MVDDGRPIAFARLVATVFTAAIVGYTGLRIGFTSDSLGYMRDARQPVSSRVFLVQRWGGPFPFLLLAKLCARNLRAIVIVQSVIAAASWLLLARTVARLIDEVHVRTAAFVAVLLLARQASTEHRTARESSAGVRPSPRRTRVSARRSRAVHRSGCGRSSRGQ
jgi:hypothetical protein